MWFPGFPRQRTYIVRHPSARVVSAFSTQKVDEGHVCHGHKLSIAVPWLSYKIHRIRDVLTAHTHTQLSSNLIDFGCCWNQYNFLWCLSLAVLRCHNKIARRTNVVQAQRTSVIPPRVRCVAFTPPQPLQPPPNQKNEIFINLTCLQTAPRKLPTPAHQRNTCGTRDLPCSFSHGTQKLEECPI